MYKKFIKVLTVLAISPLELAKTRAQAESKYMFKDLFKQLHNSGIKSLWKGVSVTLLRDVPFSGILI